MSSTRRHRSAAAIGILALLLSAAMSHYTVQPGDTLAKIAAEHDTTVAALAERNGIANPDLIVVGQELDVHTGSSSGSGSSGSGSTPSTGPTSISHLVSPGETLSFIAGLYGMSTSELMALNGITNPNMVFAGTRLVISGQGIVPLPETPTAGTGGTYTVAAGDTLSQIAGRHGVSVSELMSANGLDNADLIRIGQKLTIPGAGGFVCPVPGGTFFNDFGFPRSGGRYHEGNDLFAPRGTPVVAPVDGYVHHLVGTLGGNQFRLDGADGHRYIGTHMDSFGQAGDVRAGDVIGYVGDSGNAIGSSPHLHFEIHLNRTDVTNPYPLLAEACR